MLKKGIFLSDYIPLVIVILLRETSCRLYYTENVYYAGYIKKKILNKKSLSIFPWYFFSSLFIEMGKVTKTFGVRVFPLIYVENKIEDTMVFTVFTIFSNIY